MGCKSWMMMVSNHHEYIRYLPTMLKTLTSGFSSPLFHRVFLLHSSDSRRT